MSWASPWSGSPVCPGAFIAFFQGTYVIITRYILGMIMKLCIQKCIIVLLCVTRGTLILIYHAPVLCSGLYVHTNAR